MSTSRKKWRNYSKAMIAKLQRAVSDQQVGRRFAVIIAGLLWRNDEHPADRFAAA
ncbi:hypothetical protein JHC42_13695 [Pseudomonas sp. OA3]|jgi:hypothetical protein|nr:hypothetical protein [Pseudomonas chengduensis]MBJ7547892.1 hypothetical protein [Pseudomonas sp. OA3]MDH1558354.1 hypothetical protein [Pseudomonas chengduensis]MDH1729766.1 hypothetical protein [Pseudomonas chengduensis]WKC38139.1 hypothetical protein QYM18_03380 [Pseudomonas chengduensis]